MMKPRAKNRLSLKECGIMAMLLAASTASGTLLVHDDFDYALGTTIAAGGTLGIASDGFSNAWKFNGYSGEVVSGLGFAGLESSGNALKLKYDAAGYLFRGMTTTLSAGTYYMSMIFFRDDMNDSWGENWRWELRHASSYTYGPGSSIKVSLGSTSGEQSNLQVAGDAFQVGSPTYDMGVPIFMLAKITISDSGTETASMKWYNPGDTVPVEDNGIAWDAVSTGEFTGGSGWKLVLNVNNTEFTIDEFRLGTELADVVAQTNAGIAVPVPPATRHVFNFLDIYRIHNSGDSAKYLSVDASTGYASGSLLRLQETNSQQWVVESFTNGMVRVQAVGSPCFMRANPGTNGWSAGDSVELYPWENQAGQRWEMLPRPDGSVAFRMDGSELIMAAENLSENAAIEVSDWQDEGRQKWWMDLQDTMQSPAIVRAPNGDLLAFFRHTSPTTGNEGLLYASSDNGASWFLKTMFSQDIYGPTLFVLNSELYMLYLDVADDQKLKLKKSADSGATWGDFTVATFTDAIETSGGTAVLVKDGMLYYGFADKGGPGGWPTSFRLRVASCPTGSDLTDPGNWTVTSPLAFPSSPAVAGTEDGWLEPNCVEGPDGRVWVLARVDKIPTGDVAAVLKVSTDRTALEFSNQYPAPGNETGFIQAPWAGSSKFHIVYDATSARWLVMSNPYMGSPSSNTRHPYVRNILALYETTDLKSYRLVKPLVVDDSCEDWSLSARYTGFQYPSFIIDGTNLQYLCRTAYRSFDNYHDGNMGTYHRLEDFRKYLSPDGEMACYRFDDPQVPGLDSSKMEGADGDAPGTSYVADGRFGGCLEFNGNDASLGLMHRLSPKLHRAETVALSVWIRNNTHTGPVFTSAIDGSQIGLGLELLYGKLRMSGRSTPTDAMQTREFDYPPTGEWHHIVAQWDFGSQTMRLWLDQVEQSSTDTVAFASSEYLRGAPGYQDTIGRHFNGTSFFSGCIDDFHLYTHLLSAPEIKELFDGPGYGEWARSYALSGDAQGDDDGDGLSNLHEYALGGNPTNAADTGYAIAFQPTASGEFDYVYPRRNDPDAGIGYRVETTTNLVSGSWEDGGYTELPNPGSLDPEFDSVTNRMGAGESPSKFIRLRIEQ